MKNTNEPSLPASAVPPSDESTDYSPSLQRPSRLLRNLITVALLALIVAACGSDEVDDALDAGQSTVDSVADDLEAEADDVDEDDAEAAQSSLAESLDSLGLESLSSAVATIDIGDLTDAEEFTFFAPNDEAFTAMSAEELADLLSDPALLQDILQNHVIEERISSDDLAGRTSITSAFGTELPVAESDGAVTVDGATVVQADQDAGDGVIHVVDRLILPS